MPKAAEAAEQTLAAEIKRAVGRKKFYQNRIYLELVVYKSRTNVDAINFLDAIADVLKIAISVDDKWFGVKSIDWELDVKNPRIEIRVYQPIRKDAK